MDTDKYAIIFLILILILIPIHNIASAKNNEVLNLNCYELQSEILVNNNCDTKLNPPFLKNNTITEIFTRYKNRDNQTKELCSINFCALFTQQEKQTSFFLNYFSNSSNYPNQSIGCGACGSCLIYGLSGKICRSNFGGAWCQRC